MIRSKILFFDSNPVGRVITRFSKDMTALDLIFPFIVGISSFGIFRTVTVMFVILVINPWLLVVVAIAVYLMIVCLRFILKTVNETQRMDSIHRGPIHSSFTNIVNGLVCLRTFERLEYF